MKLLALLCSVFLAGSCLAQDLSLKLEAPEAGSRNGWKITISNNGKKPVDLVLPGDGSDCGWRTPVVGWSVIPEGNRKPHFDDSTSKGTIGRCGNINTIKSKEVFTLAPGESRELGEWIGLPSLPAPGKYRVQFSYENIPGLPIRGIPLGEHDPGVLEKIQKSEPCKLKSNEVIVEVKPGG